jgi:hypothetical protein
MNRYRQAKSSRIIRASRDDIVFFSFPKERSLHGTFQEAALLAFFPCLPTHSNNSVLHWDNFQAS